MLYSDFWNSLPKTVVNSESVTAFKSGLKTLLFSRAFSSLFSVAHCMAPVPLKLRTSGAILICFTIVIINSGSVVTGNGVVCFRVWSELRRECVLTEVQHQVICTWSRWHDWVMASAWKCMYCAFVLSIDFYNYTVSNNTQKQVGSFLWLMVYLLLLLRENYLLHRDCVTLMLAAGLVEF